MDEQHSDDATSGLPDDSHGQSAEAAKTPPRDRKERDYRPCVNDRGASNTPERADRDEEGRVAQVTGEVYARYQGPIPPPADFHAYNEVLPGAADRILRLTEKEVDAQYRLVRGEVRATTILASAVFIIPAAALVVAALGAVKSETVAVVGGLATALIGGLAALRGPRDDKK